LSACGDGDGDRDPEIRIDPVRHMEVGVARVGTDLASSAIDYVRGKADELALGLSSDDDFEVLSQTRAAGLDHVRLQQRYRGVAVLHAQVLVHADATTFIGMNGYLTRDLDGFDVTPALTEDEALAIAMNDRAAGASVEYQRQTVRLVVRPRASGGADLAWQVELFNEWKPGLAVGRWHYLIDARSGEVLDRFDGLESIDQASGPGGTPTHAVSWDSRLDVEAMGPETFSMYTDDLMTVDLDGAEGGGEWVTGDSLDDFPDPVVNDAHGYAEIALETMREWMGRDSINDGGLRLVARVHHGGVADSTAFWDGVQANFGPTDLPYESSQSLDVVAHEFGHGFTQYHSDLEYSGQSGGLNESFSDIAGTVAEFYFEGEAADFYIGEDLLDNGLILRELCSYRYWDYHDGQDPHEASAWPNRAFCLAVGRYEASTGVSPVDAVREMGHVWYAANAAYWTSGASFEEGCRGTIDAARALGHDGEITEGIAQSWADTGIECESDVFVCDEDDSCDAGEGETCASCPEDCGECMQDCGFWQKAKCDIGIGDCSRCDETEPGCGDRVCDGDETDENCPEDCGCAALSCDQVAPFGCFCDDGCEDVGDCCADVDVCD
jgi:Zn-dependent metalloprotease